MQFTVLSRGESYKFAPNRQDQQLSRLCHIRHSMLSRCYNSKSVNYDCYGGRGIKVCDRWRESYKHMLNDMGLPPEGMEIDRIDNDGDYEPANCRWTDRTTNQRNSRATKLHECEVRDIKRYIEKGKPIISIADAYHVSTACIYSIKQGRTWKEVVPRTLHQT